MSVQVILSGKEDSKLMGLLRILDIFVNLIGKLEHFSFREKALVLCVFILLVGMVLGTIVFLTQSIL